MKNIEYNLFDLEDRIEALERKQYNLQKSIQTSPFFGYKEYKLEINFDFSQGNKLVLGNLHVLSGTVNILMFLEVNSNVVLDVLLCLDDEEIACSQIYSSTKYCSTFLSARVDKSGMLSINIGQLDALGGIKNITLNVRGNVSFAI